MLRKPAEAYLGTDPTRIGEIPSAKICYLVTAMVTKNSSGTLDEIAKQHHPEDRKSLVGVFLPESPAQSSTPGPFGTRLPQARSQERSSE
jgi:hypothetical protein